MRSLHLHAAIWIAALAACVHALPAEDNLLEGESLGKITLQQKADQLTALIGKPEGKGRDVEWGATGEWVQEWRYPKQGLQLNMASETKGGAKGVLSITATAPCKLATKRGIKIGSSMADVNKAYQDVYDKEQSVPGKSFVAGSVYGGVIFTIKDGKVVGIFVGAAAE
jgi:hypothetical protein